jgi:hypothetical protein
VRRQEERTRVRAAPSSRTCQQHTSAAYVRKSAPEYVPLRVRAPVSSIRQQHTSAAYVSSIRQQHTSAAYVGITSTKASACSAAPSSRTCQQHTSDQQHTSAYELLRGFSVRAEFAHLSAAYVSSIRQQHTSAYELLRGFSVRAEFALSSRTTRPARVTSKETETQRWSSPGRHTAAYGSIRQHTAAYGSIRQHTHHSSGARDLKGDRDAEAVFSRKQRA